MATLKLIYDPITTSSTRSHSRSRSPPTLTLTSSDTSLGHINQSALILRHIQSNILISDLVPTGDPDTTPSARVLLKTAKGDKANDLLKWEYEVYEERLKMLQGSIVPRCYGLFSGRVDERGTASGTGERFGCLVLEYVRPHMDKRVDSDEFHRQLMLGLCKIHDAGIKHGNLKTHHILQMGYSPRIIDFSLATTHRCRSAHPARPTGVRDPEERKYAKDVGVCKELTKMEVFHAKDPEGIVKHLMNFERNRSRMVLEGELHTVYGTAMGDGPEVADWLDDSEKVITRAHKLSKPMFEPPPMPIPPLTYRDPNRVLRSHGQGQGQSRLQSPPYTGSSEHVPYSKNYKLTNGGPNQLRNHRSKRSFAGHRPVIPPPLNLAKTLNHPAFQVAAAPVVPQSVPVIPVAVGYRQPAPRAVHGLHYGYPPPPQALNPSQRTHGPVGYTIYR